MPKSCGVWQQNEKRSGHWKKPMKKDENGAVMTEAAIVMPLFFALILFGLELMRFSHAVLVSQIVISVTARESTTGVCPPQASSFDCSSGGRAEYAAVRTLSLARRYGLGLVRNEISIHPQSADAPSSDDAGQPQEFVVFNVDHQFSVLGGVVLLPIQSQAIGRNEPFPIL